MLSLLLLLSVNLIDCAPLWGKSNELCLNRIDMQHKAKSAQDGGKDRTVLVAIAS